MQTPTSLIVVALAFQVGILMSRPAAAETVQETVLIAAPGRLALRLFLRHTPPAAKTVRNAALLFVHGATFPSGLAAGYRMNGRSWMEDLAAQGFDVWALDLLGYGGSDRYPEMAAASSAGPPLLRSREAAEQIAAAVELVRARAGVARVSIVAHSWGTLPAGLYASEHGDRLERLVLFGPIAPRSEPDAGSDPAPAYQDVTISDQWSNFLVGVPDGQAPRIARAAFDAWAEEYMATDSTSALRQPRAVRVPFGPLADADQAARGHLPYDPARISSPTLVVRGDWDEVSTDAHCRLLYAKIGAPLKRYVVLSRGTHRMHLETGHTALWREVAAFLSADDEE